MVKRNVIAHLSDGRTSLVFAGDGGVPELVHWGAALGSDEIDPAMFERPVVGGGLDINPTVGLVTEASRGWFGLPGIEGHRPDGVDFAPRFTLADATSSSQTLTARLVDSHARLGLDLRVELTDSGVCRIDTTLRNEGDTEYTLSGLRVSLPVAAVAGELLTLGGRHNNEFAQQRTPWDRNCLVVDNRHGKTSHERLGVVFAGTPGFGEQRGEVWGCHIGWSGNYEFNCDAVTEGIKVIQVGELLLPGEVSLAPGDDHVAPTVYIAHSADGLNGVSQAFHRYLRSRPGHPRLPRPVHLNTWEAVYFNHDMETVKALADAAAEVGVDRFVLDDGWFGSRRNDRSGLGDWSVSEAVWPDGLEPLISHVRSIGMEFGIWVEPEMVNPDSDLYREHPDWVLVDPRYPLVYGRGQLVLDVGRSEVRDHLFGVLDALLRDHDIAYVKWDHNRDLVSPASAGRAGVRRQTLGVYELLDRLRAAHPNVEIETCASGGGRVDFGILERTDRVWTSDSIDALDRQAIQRGFSLVFPPELMGSHIGSPVSHVTRRNHRLSFRGLAALPGSFGVEWNILDASPEERQELAELISLHKWFAPLLHSGAVTRTDHPDPTVDVHGVVAADGEEALFFVTRLASGVTHHTDPLRIPGLVADRTYEVSIVPVAGEGLGVARRQPEWVYSNLTATGRQLAVAGFSLPQLDPENSVLLHLVTKPAAE